MALGPRSPKVMKRPKFELNERELKRIGKYLAGGSVYFWVGYGVFALSYSAFHWYWLYAKLLADAVGWSSNYIVQRFWAFSDQVHLSEMQHAGRYLFIETIGFFMDYGIIAGLRFVGISPYWGFFISAGFFSVWSYLWYKHWVFPERKEKTV